LEFWAKFAQLRDRRRTETIS